MNELAKYPRILLYGQSFNHFSGGGITLTNLFRGWPKDKIAVLTYPYMLKNCSGEICDTYYQIGREEYHWRFPFSLYKQSYNSGLLDFHDGKPENVDTRAGGFKQLIANKLINPLIDWLGLAHNISFIKISPRLKKWLSEFKPELLYIQISNRESILFTSSLIEYLGIPSAIHMMDDWPTVISIRGLFRKLWERRIDKELRYLFSKIDIHLSISDAMTAEYETRYNIKFIPFHNPITIDDWLTTTKRSFKIDQMPITVLFSGRLGPGISYSLLDIAEAIDEINASSELRISLRIQTTVKENKILKLVEKHKCVIINPVAKYYEIPRIFASADILLLANDFDPAAISFLKLSMPTKASEYMISGTPILIYAPEEIAITRFFSMNECGYCINTRKKETIIKGIIFLISNEIYRRKISENAVRLAREKFDSKIVRRDFQDLLINICS